MIPIKNSEEIQAMRTVCGMAATVLKRLEGDLVPGITTYELDQKAKEYMDDLGCGSACYNYRVGSKVFPSYTCISVDEEIVHGIGRMSRVIEKGSVVTLDICCTWNGWVGDNAKTYIVGEPRNGEDAKLVAETEKALVKGIEAAGPNKRVGDISNAIETYLNGQNLGIVRDFVGHGVGRSMHEEPQIPNFGRRGTGAKLFAGMTLAIEPMVTLGSPAIAMLEDGWTAVTRDRSTAAHFEHTVLITAMGAEVITVPIF